MSNKPLINFISIFQMIQIMDKSFSTIHKTTHQDKQCPDEGETHWLILLCFLSSIFLKHSKVSLLKSAENSKARGTSHAPHRTVLRRPFPKFIWKYNKEWLWTKEELKAVSGKVNAAEDNWTAHCNVGRGPCWMLWELGAMFINTLNKCPAVKWGIT